VPYRIVTFESVHGALKAERAIRAAGLKADAVSVPRRLSSDCGIALRFDAENEQDIIKELAEEDVSYRGIYDHEG
jgi:hypothetical protein